MIGVEGSAMGSKCAVGAVIGVAMAWLGQGCAASKEIASPRVELHRGAAVVIVDSSMGGVESSEDGLRRRVLTHALTLGSAGQVRAAVGKHSIGQTNWFAQTGDVEERAAWLMEHLRVEAVAGTALIQLEVEGVSDGLERVTILQELVETYLDRLKKERIALLLDETTILNNQRIAAEIRWNDVKKEMRDKRLKITNDGGGETGLKERELEWLARAMIDAQLEAGRARAGYDAAVTATATGGRPAGVEEAVSREQRLVRLRDQLDDASIALEAALGAAGEKDASVTAARGKVEAIRKRFEKVKEELVAEGSARRLADLKEAAEVQMSRLEGISKRVDNLKMDIGELANAQSQLRLLEEESVKTREQIGEWKEAVRRIMAETALGRIVDVRWYLRPE